MCSFSLQHVGGIRWLFPPVTQARTTAILLKEQRGEGLGYIRERSTMPDRVNYSDNFITAVTILSSPFIVPSKEILCVWCIWRSLEGILKAQECKVNAWLLDPETCFYSTWLLVGEDFVKLPSKAACSRVVLFRAICKYCIV